MVKIPNNQNIARNYSPKHKRATNNYRQPFWLPAANFYILAIAISTTVFFLAWGILHESEETPWIPAGIMGSFILGGAVILREIVLRKRRNLLLQAQEQLDFNLKNVYQQRRNLSDENKLTLEKNASILKEISRKSEAANVLGKFSDVHWEVFELCDEYLQRSAMELQLVGVGSPRLAALNQGREKIQRLHKFHLLTWSSAESRSLIQEAKISVTISKKLETATKALSILDSAIQFYPNEPQLIESIKVVNDFIATIKVSHWVEQAERAAFKGNYKRAINHYRDALFYLARENVQDSERDLIARKINVEIEKIREIISKDKR